MSPMSPERKAELEGMREGIIARSAWDEALAEIDRLTTQVQEYETCPMLMCPFERANIKLSARWEALKAFSQKHEPCAITFEIASLEREP